MNVTPENTDTIIKNMRSEGERVVKKYLVEVIEHHTDKVWVEAESEDDAKDKAMELSDCRFKCIDECEVIFEAEIERE